MQILAVANQKGGVGKTTTAMSLGAGLNRSGYSVLLVDLDPQCNLSFTAGVDLLNTDTTLYDVFKRKKTIKDAIIPIQIGFDIVPGDIALASADTEFTGVNRNGILRRALRQIDGDFDFVICDTPPSIGLLTINALIACHRLIVPVRSDVYALQGISQLSATIEDVQEELNPELKVDGILVTDYNSRTTISKTMIPKFERLAEEMEAKLYDTKIRSAVAASESAFLRSNLFEAAPKAGITADYSSFVDEFLKGA